VQAARRKEQTESRYHPATLGQGIEYNARRVGFLHLSVPCTIVHLPFYFFSHEN